MKKIDVQKSVLLSSQELKDKFKLYAIPKAEDYRQLVDAAALAKQYAGDFSQGEVPGVGLTIQDRKLAVAQGPGVVTSQESGIALNIDEESGLYFDDGGGLAVKPTQTLSLAFFEALSQAERERLFYWFYNADMMNQSPEQLPQYGDLKDKNQGLSICFSRDGQRLITAGRGTENVNFYSRTKNGWEWSFREAAMRGANLSPLCADKTGSVIIRGRDIHPNDDGSLTVFRESNASWGVNHITVPVGVKWFFGTSVAMGNNASLLVVGAPAWNDGGVKCGAIVLIPDLSADIKKYITLPAPEEGDLFGSAVNISADGRVIAASAPGRNSSAGEVTLYIRYGEQWVAQPPLTPDGNGGKFGTSLSLNDAGDMLAVGCPEEENKRGAVYLYRRCNGQWECRAKLTGDASAGEEFGYRVALSGDGGTLAVSSPRGKNKNEVVTGAAWWFGADLQLRRRLLAEDGAAGHKFGQSVALAHGGNLLAVGAPEASTTGKVYLYE